MKNRSINNIISTLSKANSSPKYCMPLEGMYEESYATHISNANTLEQAFAILDIILQSRETRKFPNVSIFEALIKKCLKSGDIHHPIYFDYASEIYIIADQAGIKSLNMDINMIKGSARYVKPTIADMACQNAISYMKINNCETPEIYHTMINNLVKLGKPKCIKRAKEIYLESHIHPEIILDKNGKVKTIDFHSSKFGSTGFNCGSTYIALLVWLEQEKAKFANENDFSIIGVVFNHGLGNNSEKRDKNGHHPVKAGVYLFFSEMQKIYDVPYTEHPGNPGLVTCFVQRKLPTVPPVPVEPSYYYPEQPSYYYETEQSSSYYAYVAPQTLFYQDPSRNVYNPYAPNPHSDSLEQDYIYNPY